MRLFTLFLLCLTSLVQTMAQTPTMVKDMTPSTGSSDPLVSGFNTVFNGSIYFSGYDNGNAALFKSDGTDAGTVPVAALKYTGEAAVLGSVMIIESMHALWKTDGTVLGTSLLFSQQGVSSFSSFRVVGSNMFFLARSSAGQELWKTDGTTAGTSLVKDIYPGVNDSDCSYLTGFQGKLFFSATDGVKGSELWVSDGTLAGTTLLKDIEVGSSGSNPMDLFVHNATLYFSADTSTAGRELWKSDGTEPNTLQVIDINPGPPSTAPGHFVDLAGTLVFTCVDATHGSELWKTNGTAAGTSMIKDHAPGSDWGVNGKLFVSEGKLYFNGYSSASGWEPGISDGTLAGTVLLKDIESGVMSSYSSNFHTLGSSVIFTATTSTQGMELWITDGTTAGTHIVVDLAVGSQNGIEAPGFVLNNRFYFSLINGDKFLWSSDGTAAGTVRTTNRTGSLASDQAQYGNNGSKFFFDMNTSTPDTRSLGLTDGSNAGTIPLHAAGLKNPLYMTAAGTNTFFLAGTSTHSWGHELWKSDGTLAGTTLIKFHSPSLFQTITHLTTYQSKAYYVAIDEPSFAGHVIWQSDGTTAGTTVFTGPGTYEYLSEYNGKLVFYADIREEISVSDGTIAGTSVVDTGYVYNGFFEFNGKLMYSGSTAASGDIELWSFDGSSVALIKDLPPSGTSSYPSGFTKVGSLMYFQATGVGGKQQLWKTDGTPSNTVMVAELENPFGISLLGGFDNKLYFIQSTAQHGKELWVSDGTALGTKLVIDTVPGSLGGVQSGWVSDNRLYLKIWQHDKGSELWTSDGTASGTHILADLMPGPIGNNIIEVTALSRDLYFTAASSGNNRELWTVPILPNAAIWTVTPYVCPSTSALTASVMAATGSGPTYSWSATNATITSATNTRQITYSSGAAGQVQLNVTVTDSGGTSQKSLILPIRSNLGSPGSISGPADPCIGSQVTYSVPTNPDVDTFTWQVPLSSTILSGQGTHSIQVTVGSNPGQVSVIAQNPCSATAPSNLSIVPVAGFPAVPISITGVLSICESEAGLVYSTPVVSGVSSYTWTVPAGASIATGQGTSSIIVNFGTTSGSVSVLATNGCGSSQPYSVTVNVNAPPSASNAGQDQNLPAGQVAQLSANQPAVGTGTWLVISGPNTQISQFSNTGSNTSTFTPIVSSGSYTLRWTISNSTCNDSTDNLVLNYATPQNVNLALQISRVVSNPSVGEQTDLTVTISNSGIATATGIHVFVSLPADVELPANGATLGTYYPAQTRWEISALSGGSSAELTLSGYPTSLGDKPIEVEVTQCNETDVNSTPNNHLLLEDDQDLCTWQPADYVHIPDPVFKFILTTDPSVDTYDDDEISPFEAVNIYGIDCAYQGVADLTGLESFVNLQYISASGNPITVLPDLTGLSLLQTLMMDDCQLNSLYDINDFFALPLSLTTLSLSGNHLQILPPEVFFMTFMQFLVLSNNPLGVMMADAFDLFPDLLLLELTNIGIREVPSSIGLSPMLEHLGLGQNNLRELPFIMPATLKSIDLTSNRLVDISPLEFCPLLEAVILSQNHLEDISALKAIPDLLTQDFHYVLVNRNRLDVNACPDISELLSRANISNAYFEYNPQGNFSFLYHELPQWEIVPDRLMKWVNDVTQENYIYNVSCP